MKLSKKNSVINFVVVSCLTSLTVSCQPGALDFLTKPKPAPTTTQATASLTGILYTGSSDERGRFSPPEERYTIEILGDDNKAILTTESDLNGRFYIGGIPATPSGKAYTVKIGNDLEVEKSFFPGRVLDLASVKVSNLQDQLVRVSGILLTTSGQPLANTDVRDKTATFRSTRTDSTGRFSLEVKGKELEILNGLAPISISVEEVKKTGTIRIDTTNIRSVTGRVLDKTNSNLLLSEVKIKVQGRSVSTLSKKDGTFVLNGAPVDPFIMEVEAPKGYAKMAIDVPPAVFENQKPLNISRDLLMQPIGSIQINFTAETSPDFVRLPTVIRSGQEVCGSYLNCLMFDLTGPGRPPRPEYTNNLAVRNILDATVTVEGTGIVQKIKYPPAPFRILYGADQRTGDPVKVADLAVAANVVYSVTLDNIPGGKQSITVSMTGFQTQKSLPIYVPSNDIISTELITMYRVEPISSFGDVKGIIKGTQPLPAGKELRLVYLDVKEDLDYEPILGDETDPDLLEAIEDGIQSGHSVLAKENNAGPDGQTGTSDDKFNYHEYHLKNVPSGTRIMLAAVIVDDDNTLSDCYIPSTSVLLNVRPGQINLAPDLELTARPDETGCSK